MAGGVGHTGGLTNPCPWRGRCRAGFSNTGGPPLPRKRAPFTKKDFEAQYYRIRCLLNIGSQVHRLVTQYILDYSS